MGLVPLLLFLAPDPIDPSGDPADALFSTTRLSPGVWSTRQLVYSPYQNPVDSIDEFDGLSTGIVNQTQASTSPDQGYLFGLTSNATPNIRRLYSFVDNSNPPVKIDNASPLRGDEFFEYGKQGSFFYNGFWWLIGGADVGAVKFKQLRVYKSATRALGSWIAVDTANEPPNSSKNHAFDWDGVSSIIHCCYNDALTGVLSLVEFDMSGTGSWGAPHDTPPIDPNFVAQTLSYSASTGITHVFAQGSPGQYSYFDGAAWVEDISIGRESDQIFYGLIDPNGTTVHLFFGDGTDCYYQQFLSGGALGPAFTFPSSAVGLGVLSGGELAASFGRGVILDSQMYVGVAWGEDSTGLYQAACYVVTDLALGNFTTPEMIDTLPSFDCEGVYASIGGSVTPVAARPLFLPEYIKRRNAHGNGD